MRTAIVAIAVATAIVVTSSAASAGPPSKTLERAIMLYDKKDFLSASIELGKVIDGETSDDAPNRARAEFFQAKTLVNLEFRTAAVALFDRIQVDPQHLYYTASLKWILSLAPNSHAHSLGRVRRRYALR